MSGRSLVYLPVEVGKRELMSRAFLSSRLAGEGNDVLVFVSDLFDAAGWPGPGVYIGKNVLRKYAPHDMAFYCRMKEAGVEIWYHDEEGGLYPGTDPDQWADRLVKRMDPTVFHKDDKILAWGNFQAEVYRSTGIEADVHVTGSVNFELYRPEYHSSFDQYDAAQTNGLRDYVLVNTRTPGANSAYHSDTHIINTAPYKFSLNNSERFDRLAHEGVVLYEMVGLVAEIAIKHPQQMIVLRPHPSEDQQLYARIFAEFRNILVTGEGDAGAWIRRCRCLLQNGCTTAIQASIAEKRVITYVPPGTEASAFVSPFPNEIGAVTETRSDAIEAIFANDVPQNKGSWGMVISSLTSISDIAALVASRGADERVDKRRLASSVARRQWDMRARKLAYRFAPHKRAEYRLREKLLDRSLFDRFDKLVTMAGRHWNAPVNATRLSSDCWRVRPA